MTDQTSVQVLFTVHDDETGLDFTDALYYPLADWPVPDAELEAAKRERFQAWKVAVATPPDAPSADLADDPRADVSAIVQQAMDTLSLAQRALVANGDNAAAVV